MTTQHKRIRHTRYSDRKVAEVFVGGILSFMLSTLICMALGLEDTAAVFIGIMIVICWLSVRGDMK